MDSIIYVLHGITATFALISGTFVTFAKKGTSVHKRVGKLYVVSMLIMLVSSFGMFTLFGRFGVYHVMSLISLFSILIGMYYPLFGRHKPYWVVSHYFWMVYSFIGLVMALGSHLMNSMPPSFSFWEKAGLAWVLPYVAGSILVFSYKKRITTEFVKQENANLSPS